MTDDNRYLEAAERERRKAHWPKGVRAITIDEMDMIGLDPDANLYWDGKPVEVKKSFSLTFWQKVGAVLTVLSAVCAAAASVISVFVTIG